MCVYGLPDVDWWKKQSEVFGPHCVHLTETELMLTLKVLMEHQNHKLPCHKQWVNFLQFHAEHNFTNEVNCRSVPKLDMSLHKHFDPKKAVSTRNWLINTPLHDAFCTLCDYFDVNFSSLDNNMNSLG